MEKQADFPILLLGYGNVDREDDGVAWHVLSRLAIRLGRTFPILPEDFEFHPGEPVDFYYTLQLAPEMVDLIRPYARICFIDAHTGAYPQDIHVESVQPIAQASPFTHLLTPATLLHLAQTIYPSSPESILISIRGYDFGFRQELSPATSDLADQAVTVILSWIGKS